MIEVIYSRYMCLYSEDFITIDEALKFINYSSEEGYLYPIGVYEDSKPVIYNGFISQDFPNEHQETRMIEIYQRIKNHIGPGAPSAI